MADIVSKQRRSEIMSSVKSKDSKIEQIFRAALWRAGYRYRKNARGYFGKPDAVLKKHKVVVFVDSCFFHGCRTHGRLPASNKKYWKDKIERNKIRDREVNRHYKKTGWRVVRVWEHGINKTRQSLLPYLRKISKK